MWQVLQYVTVIKTCNKKLLRSVTSITSKVWQDDVTELDNEYKVRPSTCLLLFIYFPHFCRYIIDIEVSKVVVWSKALMTILLLL